MNLTDGVCRLKRHAFKSERIVERVKQMFKTLKRIITDTKRFEPF